MLSCDPDHWNKYNQAQVGRAPRDLLVDALPLVKPDGIALDLGAGAGIETLYMIKHGLFTYSVEPAKESSSLIKSALSNISPELALRSTYVDSTFEEFSWSKTFDLIYAGYSLPYCNPQSFMEVWGKILDSLAPGGVLAVDLFGDQDDWAAEESITTVTRDWLESSLKNFRIIQITEKVENGKTFSGSKFWHTFEVIAQKIT